MLRYLILTVGSGFVADFIDRAVFVSVCARRVTETLILNADYFVKRMTDFTELLLLGKISVNIAKICDGTMKRAPGKHLWFLQPSCRHAFWPAFHGKLSLSGPALV